MRVWQPGSSLVSQRSMQVDDWSWAATKRRLTALYRLARPYRLRTALSVFALLAATAASLAPPILVGVAVDDVRAGDTGSLTWIVAAFLGAGLVGIGASWAQTYFTGLDRRADARRPPQPPLPAPAAPVARVLRAQPCGRSDQQDDQ